MMRRILLGTAAFMSASLATAARAQDDFSLGEVPPPKPPAPYYANHVELGAGFQSVTSYYFARYGGVPDRGLFGIADVTADHRDPWDSGGTHFWNADIIVAGFDRISAIVNAGDQGLWRTSFFYDRFTRFFTENAKTPFDGVGSNQLTLPANWRTSGSSFLFSNLTADLKPL